ncbi:MAG: WYL domain-containing protein [Lachnospiraceae bacterium]|nr:WYL domain-containing protein [Lachnospiraceae bacterium]
MAKGPQKLKILYLAKVLLEETDEEHALMMNEIISRLSDYGIEAERKGLYTDIEDLRAFGLDIIGEKRGRYFSYYIGSRKFELPELKLLVDSVLASKFISEKKSKELVKKLEGLTSREEAKELNREIVISGRVKTVNEGVLYTVDSIHQAIADDRKIKFRYFQWNRKKERELRHGGAFYTVSPWALLWDDEYYYLVAFDGMIKHYRVDKILELSVTDENREGRESFEKIDMGSYAKMTFSMFKGEEENVTIEAENRFAGMLIDRFGHDIFIMPVDEDHFRVRVTVAVSEQFISWVFSLGDGIRITGPDNVTKRIHETVERLSRQYP